MSSSQPLSPGGSGANQEVVGVMGDPKSLLQALPWGIAVADEKGQIVYLNSAARAYEQPRHGDTLVYAELEDVARSAAAGTTLRRPVKLYGPPARSFELRGAPIFNDHGIAGSLVVIQDVTQAQELERVRRDFVANVSHELKTPVGAIAVLAETLIHSEEPQVVDRLIGRVHHESVRLGHLVDDLLALSALELGEIVEPELVDSRQVVVDAIGRTRTAADQAGVEIITSVASASGLMVLGDHDQLVSAVVNLVDNAVKYSSAGSEVAVKVSRHGDQVQISVRDEGVGIPRDAQGRIFERFYRVDNARSRSTGGTGLGLSIVRHAIMNHHGSVGLESAEGKGSTFTLNIPQAKQGPYQ